MTASSTRSLPAYWLPQPPMQLDVQMRQACDRLLAEALQQGAAQPLVYTLPIPKWQFLCYVTEKHNLALHGSGDAGIEIFEPRQPVDLTDFGAQKAVYAAADGIWPLYFAIVHRSHSPTLLNACIYVEQADGTLGEPHYFFSISRRAMARQPYRSGTLYLLPGGTFVRQPPLEVDAWCVHTSQLASMEPVAPLAKLTVAPEDFPFLRQMRVHDDERLQEYAIALQQGLPLPE